MFGGAAALKSKVSYSHNLIESTKCMLLVQYSVHTVHNIDM